MKKFELVPEFATADICFRAFGKTLEEAFENSAMAMFEIMVDTKKISLSEEKEIKVKADDLEGLLFDFLTELLYLHDSQKLVFKKFPVKISEKEKKYFLACKAKGCKFSEKITARSEVKAVTYSKMEIAEDKGKWKIQVVLDL